MATNEKRENFRKALAAFESEFEGLIDSDDFKRWNGVAHDEILELKRSGIREYTNGNYAGAQKLISDASVEARSKLEQRQAEFDSAMEQAAKELVSDNYDNALVHANSALRIFKGRTEAEQLRAQIEKLPPILEKLEEASIARAEGNVSQEYAALERVLKLDPTRSAAASRIKELEKAVREQMYSQAVQMGLEGIAKRDLALSADNLRAAKKIFPGRDETKLLAAKVEELGRELRGRSLLGKAELAASEDNWREALSLFQSAARLLPGDQKVVAGQEVANRILLTKSRVGDALKSSHRLAAPNVAAATQKMADDARDVEVLSPGLKSSLEELRRLLRLYAEPVPVLVRSDGQANVSVRGVGRVGTVKEKTIKLTPGSYKFECTRPGHKSKLMDVDVQPGVANKSVRITCNEPV